MIGEKYGGKLVYPQIRRAGHCWRENADYRRSDTLVCLGLTLHMCLILHAKK